MEMDQPDLPPPVPPKTRPRPAPQQLAPATVLPNGTASVSLVDVSDSRQFATGHHVVKISINPQSGSTTRTLVNGDGKASSGVFDDKHVDVSGGENAPCIRISLNRNTPYSDADMIQKQNQEITNNFFYYGGYNLSSGQVSPSDTLDSGTCSDLDGTPPPAITKKRNGVSVTVIGSHKRAPSSSSGAEIDSDDNDSNSSCDSITSGKISPLNLPPHSPAINNNSPNNSHTNSINDSFKNFTISSLTSFKNSSNSYAKDVLKSSVVNPNYFTSSSDSSIEKPLLPATLLQDIRQRTPKSPSSFPPPSSYTASPVLLAKVDEKSYEERKEEEEEKTNRKNAPLDPNMFYKFHLNEHTVENSEVTDDEVDKVDGDETFAGYRDILSDGASTIRSAKGTVRGVKNRVRAGIATFLQINEIGKNYKEKDAGKVVVYTTTMGVLRTTYQACMRVKQILRLLMVKFEERDVFMSSEYQGEIHERMRTDQVLVPQVFVDGVHVGDAETIERLNETGELRRIMKPYKSLDVCTTCKVCGGYRLLPCQICKGSKKSVHRNHFTAEFVALKCMNCDEVGLVRCSYCS